jgi:hypothetical protein
MLSSLLLAVSCVGGSAAAQCAECERLEAEFLEARDRARNLTRLRSLNAVEEKKLADRVAMVIARAKEHAAGHAGFVPTNAAKRAWRLNKLDGKF